MRSPKARERGLATGSAGAYGLGESAETPAASGLRPCRQPRFRKRSGSNRRLRLWGGRSRAGRGDCNAGGPFSWRICGPIGSCDRRLRAAVRLAGSLWRERSTRFFGLALSRRQAEDHVGRRRRRDGRFLRRRRDRLRSFGVGSLRSARGNGPQRRQNRWIDCRRRSAGFFVRRLRGAGRPWNNRCRELRPRCRVVLLLLGIDDSGGRRQSTAIAESCDVVARSRKNLFAPQLHFGQVWGFGDRLRPWREERVAPGGEKPADHRRRSERQRRKREIPASGTPVRRQPGLVWIVGDPHGFDIGPQGPSVSLPTAAPKSTAQFVASAGRSSGLESARPGPRGRDGRRDSSGKLRDQVVIRAGPLRPCSARRPLIIIKIDLGGRKGRGEIHSVLVGRCVDR